MRCARACFYCAAYLRRVEDTLYAVDLGRDVVDHLMRPLRAQLHTLTSQEQVRTNASLCTGIQSATASATFDLKVWSLLHDAVMAIFNTTRQSTKFEPRTAKV